MPAKIIINQAMIPRRYLRLLSRYATAATCILAAFAHASEKKAPPPKPAAQYAAFDTHEKEHVTIAVEPCNDPKLCDFFRLPYIQHGFIPIRVIVTNDGDTAISLEDARMQFISADNDRIPAADLDELNRRLFTFKSAQGTKIPLIPLTIHHAPIDKKITQDDNDFGFNGTTVQAHSTLAGYLFYDVKSLDDPPLKNAELYIKMVHTLDGKQQLFAFTIPLNKWLAANQHPTQKPDQKQAAKAPETPVYDATSNPDNLAHPKP